MEGSNDAHNALHNMPSAAVPSQSINCEEVSAAVMSSHMAEKSIGSEYIKISNGDASGSDALNYQEIVHRLHTLATNDEYNSNDVPVNGHCKTPSASPQELDSIERNEDPLVTKDETGISYVRYQSEIQMSDIMTLISGDLSEPYSIYTYRYFIHNWPKLCFLVNMPINSHITL